MWDKTEVSLCWAFSAQTAFIFFSNFTGANGARQRNRKIIGLAKMGETVGLSLLHYLRLILSAIAVALCVRSTRVRETESE